MDSFHGHTTEDAKKALKTKATDQVIIPGALTSMLQPLDVCINRAFKATQKEQYINAAEMKCFRQIAGKTTRPHL
jgi:hypothetical protein